MVGKERIKQACWDGSASPIKPAGKQISSFVNHVKLFERSAQEHRLFAHRQQRQTTSVGTKLIVSPLIIIKTHNNVANPHIQSRTEGIDKKMQERIEEPNSTL